MNKPNKQSKDVTMLILAHVCVAETKAALKRGIKNCAEAEH